LGEVDEPHARSRRHRRLIDSDKRCDASCKKDGWGFSSQCVLRVTRPPSSAFSPNDGTTRNGILKVHHRHHNTLRLGVRLTAMANSPARGPLAIFHRANCRATAAELFALIRAEGAHPEASCAAIERASASRYAPATYGSRSSNPAPGASAIGLALRQVGEGCLDLASSRHRTDRRATAHR